MNDFLLLPRFCFLQSERSDMTPVIDTVSNCMRIVGFFVKQMCLEKIETWKFSPKIETRNGMIGHVYSTTVVKSFTSNKPRQIPIPSTVALQYFFLLSGKKEYIKRKNHIFIYFVDDHDHMYGIKYK